MALFNIFGKHREERQRKSRSLNEWIIIIVLTMVIVQAIGLLINAMFGTPLYLGPAFLLIAIAASVLLAFTFTTNLMKSQPMDKKDIIVMIIVFGITILAVIYLRGLVPEIFKPSALALQSIILP